ncbi:MAG: YncE family protein [Sulfuricellaceae bacterium]|nr:YncE family protein [Sulfuricellaceae bacterium]
MSAHGINKYNEIKMAVTVAMLCVASGASSVTFSYLDNKSSCTSLTLSNSGAITCNTVGTSDVPYNFATSLICSSGLEIELYDPNKKGAVTCATKLPECTLSASSNQVVPGGTITLTAKCSNTPSSYQWTHADSLVPGQGNTATVTLPSTATSATYAYSVLGINSQGTGNPATALVTVARSGQKGPFAYVAHQADASPLPGNLSVIDTSTNLLVSSVKVGVYPAGVVVSPDETKVYVANAGSNTVSVIDAMNNTVAATIEVGQSPLGIATNHAGSRLYVANTNSNTLSMIDSVTRKVVSTIVVGSKPHGIAVNRSDSRVYVSNYAENTLSVIDAGTGVAITPAVAVGVQPEGVAVSGSRVFVANSGSNTLSIIDTASANAITTVNVGKHPLGIAVNPAGTQVYVANYGDRSVSVVDIASAKLVNTVAVGILPTYIAFEPTGALAYVTNQGENTVSIIDTSAGAAVAGKSISITPGALYGYGKFIGGNSENYQGLWWNPDENGWGLSLAQHNDMAFGAMYTYDSAGKPTWYVMSSCPLLASSCTGDIHKVSGGTSPLAAWNGSGKAVMSVGSGTLAFSGANNAIFSYTIDGKAGSKSITRQVFKTEGVQASTDYTDLWGNENESGWGVELTQQYETIFATWYAYDDKGSAVWYVASDCKMSAPDVTPGCTGVLYQVTGGSALTSPWNPASKVTTAVGSISFAFSDPSNGTMNYTINGVSASRTVSRQVF